jgi:toxin ParE1/3/4
MTFRLSKEAAGDLDEIFLYWAQRASLQTADRLLDSIAERFLLLGQHPEAGKPSPDIAPGVRCFPAGKYLIYYRTTSRTSDILRILHGARDQNQAFQPVKKRS